MLCKNIFFIMISWTLAKIYIKDIFCGFFHTPQQKYVGKESTYVTLCRIFVRYITKQYRFWYKWV